MADNTVKQEAGSKKYPCPSCGAQMVHNASAGKLKCEFCGHSEDIKVEAASAAASSAAATSTSAPKEYDLEEALRSGKFHRGWGLEMRSVKCRSCGALSDVSLTVSATNCTFCGSAQIVEEKVPEDVITPENVIPFSVDKAKALEAFRKWIGEGFAAFFRPSELKRSWNLGKIGGAYMPFWTFDADTHSQWSAMAGYHYYVEERDASGKTRRVQKTRWEPASGSYNHFYDDELVFASKGLSLEMVLGIYPYDLKKLVPYKSEYLAGWVAERYTVGLKEAWGVGKDRIDDKIKSSCASLVPGDTHRDLRVATSWGELKFKHVLLPLWVATYEYGGKTYRFLVNGQNGNVDGEAPISWLKVALAVFAGLLAVGVIVLLAR